MRFIGMDVHVRNSFLCVTEADGTLVRRGRVGNSLAQLAQFLAPLEDQPHEPVRAVLESTTNSRAIARMVQAYGTQSKLPMQVQVLDARKLRVIAQSVCKHDRQDAAVLAELARSNLKLPVCHLPDDDTFALRERLRGRADLVRLRTMLKNRVHALLHRRGLLHGVKDLFTALGRAWLKQLELDEAGREILDRLLATVDALESAIKPATAALNKLACGERWAKQAELLDTMPGIGPITALTILAELGDLQRFKSRASVSNYAGLVPITRDSNAKHFSGHITRRGPAHLRAVLVEAAWTSKARVPQYAAIFERVSSRKGKQVAIVAVARRMLEDAWTMLKRKEAFRFTPVATDAGVCTAATGQRIDDRNVDPSDAG